MQEPMTCERARCQNATDFIDLCDTCIAEFNAWIEMTHAFSDDDMDAWVEANQPDHDAQYQNPPDFDPPYFDKWTLNESPRQTSDQCSFCLRIVGNPNPHVTLDERGKVVSCESCQPRPKRKTTTKGSGEKKVTRKAAERFCEIFSDAYILDCDFASYLYRKIGNCHKVIAEILKGETADA